MNGWFEFVCLHCSGLIARLTGYRYLGGWLPHEACGHETLFSASNKPGPCAPIQVRPLVRANCSPDDRTTLQFGSQ